MAIILQNGHAKLSTFLISFGKQNLHKALDIGLTRYRCDTVTEILGIAVGLCSII